MHGSVYEAFQSGVRMGPGNAYLCVPPGSSHEPEGLEWTYSQVDDRVAAAISVYRAAGYGAGHRVALLLENRPDHFVHFLALNALGVSQVPVNPDYRSDELGYLLADSDADLLVCRGSHMDLALAAAQIAPRRPPVVDADAWPASLPPVL